MQTARQFGADLVFSGDAGRELDAAVLESTGGRGADVVFDMTGSTDAIERGLSLLRIGGRLVLVGATHPARPLVVSAESLVRRVLTVSGLHNCLPEDLVTAVSFLAAVQPQHPFGALVGASFPLDRVNEAFAAARSGLLRVAVGPQRTRAGRTPSCDRQP